MLIERIVLSCVLVAVAIAFSSQRSRSADMHAKIDAALAAARELEATAGLRIGERDEKPTLH